VNHQLAEAMAYLTEAHTSLVIAREEAEGRLEEHFAATLEAWQELVNELALLQRRATFEKGH